MLVRNTLIYQDNGAGEISQGAVLSRTNQMPGNERRIFILFPERPANITKLLPPLLKAEKVKLTPRTGGFLPGVTIHDDVGCRSQERFQRLFWRSRVLIR